MSCTDYPWLWTQGYLLAVLVPTTCYPDTAKCESRYNWLRKIEGPFAFTHVLKNQAWLCSGSLFLGVGCALVFCSQLRSCGPSQGPLLGLEGNLIILLLLSNSASFEQNPLFSLAPGCLLFPGSYFQPVLAFAVWALAVPSVTLMLKHFSLAVPQARYLRHVVCVVFSLRNSSDVLMSLVITVYV